MPSNILDDQSWRPDPKVDSREYIWGIDFKVRIPRVDTYSEGYLKLMGIPSSGDEAFDKVMQGELITTWKSINLMIEIFRTGGRVHIVDHDDCVKIYHYIDNHLDTWRRHLENSPINSNRAPVDDLILCDEFSEVVFQYARWEYVNDDQLAFLRRQFGAQWRHTVSAIQEAIPTMAAIRNKRDNAALQAGGSNIRIADANEVMGSKPDYLDAYSFKMDAMAELEGNLERKLPKRDSFAGFFEQYREDKSIMKVAPSMDQRFQVPNRASNSLNNRLGKGI